MKLEDLQKILAKMTPRPWLVGCSANKAFSSDTACDERSGRVFRTDPTTIGMANRDGILTLVNNAGLLLTIAASLKVLFQVADERGWVVGGVEKCHAPQGEGPVVKQLRALLAQLEES